MANNVIDADNAERQRQPGYHEDPDGGGKTIGQRSVRQADGT